MYGRIANLMAWRAGLLMAGCGRALARENLFPYAVYLPGRLRVLQTEDEAARSYARLLQQLQEGGTRHLDARVAAVALPRGQRLRVWVDWVVTRADDSRQQVARTVEYLRETPAGLRAEMTECSGLRLVPPG